MPGTPFKLGKETKKQRFRSRGIRKHWRLLKKETTSSISKQIKQMRNAASKEKMEDLMNCLMNELMSDETFSKYPLIKSRLEKYTFPMIKRRFIPIEYYAFLSQFEYNSDGKVNVVFELVTKDWMEANILKQVENVLEQDTEDYFKTHPLNIPIPVNFFHIENTTISALSDLLRVKEKEITEGEWYNFYILPKDAKKGITGTIYSDSEWFNV
jgi:hypothetical protein